MHMYKASKDTVSHIHLSAFKHSQLYYTSFYDLEMCSRLKSSLKEIFPTVHNISSQKTLMQLLIYSHL